MREAASTYEIEMPPAYNHDFMDRAEPQMTLGDRFMLAVADLAVRDIASRLITIVDELVRESAVRALGSDDEVERICKRFEIVVPATRSKSLVDILNAAWRAFEDEQFWSHLPEVSSRKEDVLRELVLKNIELFEVDQIVVQDVDAEL